jgi:hypothetical protein
MLSPWQWWMLLSLAGIAVVYVAYFRIWLAFAFASDLLFVIALGLGVASIATPGPFERIADLLVSRSPLPAALLEADARVEALASLPDDLIEDPIGTLGFEVAFERLLRHFGLANDEANPDAVVDDEAGGAEHPLPRSPAPSVESHPTGDFLSDPVTQGPITRWIQPSVLALLTLVLRGAGLVISGTLIFLSLTTRTSTTTARRLAQLTARVESLESSGLSSARAATPGPQTDAPAPTPTIGDSIGPT